MIYNLKKSLKLIITSLMVLLFTIDAFANGICKESNCDRNVYKEDYCLEHYKVNRLKNIAADYVLDLVPFGLGGLTKDVVEVMLEGKDNEEYDKVFQNAAKKIETVKFGKVKVPASGQIRDLEWYVVNKDNNKKLLILKSRWSKLCAPYDKVLAENEYYNMDLYDPIDDEYVSNDELIKEATQKNINYNSSFVREYLNNTFFNECFDNNEKNRIINTEVTTAHIGLDDKTNEVEVTNDKIFIPGISDIDMYFSKNIEMLRERDMIENQSETLEYLNLYKYHSSYGNFLLRDIKEDMITDINDEDEVIRVNNYKPYLYSAYNYDGKISIESHNFGGGYMYELQPMMWITE